ncbi:39S ribosomal protein L22, mitochondrial [Frankliniella fusca]|uniref:Large ribosomal subunit protein uL22m n=1 Tax=Frankliniella fusca TaxID=407009 RepID=A0AAE1LCS4_9NEOP|nr:39S ribosomal protein L22, mitochondrial [Frankliniella fusca]
MFCLNAITKQLRPVVLFSQAYRNVSKSEEWSFFVDKDKKISRWRSLNDKVFEPLKEGEERRPAFVCHEKRDIWYSFKKLYIVSCFVRGLSVDDAVNQLNFVSSKGAKIVKDTILEAQDIAVREHNVEFKSNLWVAESFPERAYKLKAYRRHAKGRFCAVELSHVHYLVRLEEGTPPKHYYYYRRPRTPQELLDEYLDELRKRKVINSL